MTIPKITYDGTLDVATGRHRRETNWKNKQLMWSELLQRLSETHRTAETHAEYLAAKKPRQDEIKDIGGFVGGLLANGKRKNGSVVHRQLITLDLDFAKVDSWDNFQMLYDSAACVYSTHKHSPDKPRLRLIMPLSREVMADEYVAICRRVAGNIGIEDFDPTGFRPAQLMYWPSTPRDGEYVFEYQDGAWLDADEVLRSYHDWRDASEWPMSVREQEIPLRAIKKQGDPLEKTGIVGAFCRAYSIHEAIEKFLPDVYTPCDVDDRYTYSEGSTAAGLVVYEDKYAYSHHGTDPISGKLCNSFDLVRLHKFGLKDEDCREGTPSNKLPSYTAMQEFSMKDKGVVMQLGAEKMGLAEVDFADDLEGDESGKPARTGSDGEAGDEDESWTAEMDADKKGNYQSTIKNIVLVLRNHPLLKNRIYLNEFEGRLMVTKALPWRKVTRATRDFTDDDMDCLSHFLEEKCKVPFTHVQKALAIIRNENKVHPVKDYLESLNWDGEERLERLFIDYLGAEESDYCKEVARKTLVAAVARVMQPGVKFDTVLTFVGKQGIGKSTLVAKLARGWFSDCLGDIHGKEGMESLRGVWIMEVAELASFRKADLEAIKRFISSREDQYRPAYGRQLMRFPRQCIFIATTNVKDFLKDNERRFWPVETYAQEPVKDIFKDLNEDEIDQVWAEAVELYNNGETLHLSAEMAAAAEKAREGHTETDDRQGNIQRYLDMMLPDGWEKKTIWERREWLNREEDSLEDEGIKERTTVCIPEIWCELLGGTIKEMNSQNTRYLHEIMRKMKGWERIKSSRRFGIYGTQRGYEKLLKPGVNKGLVSVDKGMKGVNSVNKIVNRN